MPSRGRPPSRRRESGSDSLEALKPLLVLGLLGMILYGAYTVVQKGKKDVPIDDAPAFAAATDGLSPPQIDIAQPAAVQPAAASRPQPPPAAGPTYLNAISAPPPAIGDVPAKTAPVVPPPPPTAVAAVAPPPVNPPLTPDAFPAPRSDSATANSIGTAPPIDAPVAASSPPFEAAPMATQRSQPSAFSAAWADAHDKLGAGRYAEALAVLSAWYDDPTLGIEESQRLEELLGQLAGTVIYSQGDLLLPPHIVAPGETLPAIAATLAVPWQLLAKINGVDAPASLLPGEALKVVRGPFDAVVSVSRRRLSLQLAGNYAGSFPVVIGRRIQDRVGASLAVAEIRRDSSARQSSDSQAAAQVSYLEPHGAPSIVLGEGLRIESADDPLAVSDAAPEGSLVVSARDLTELVDILGQGSHVLIRQ